MANILLIESSRAIRTILKDRLSAEQHTVTVAESVASGEGKLLLGTFDCLITDAFISNTGGIPWILTANNLTEEIRTEATELGAVECVSKPINMSKMSKAINKSLQTPPAADIKEKHKPRSVAVAETKTVPEFDPIVGSAPATLRLKRIIDMVASTPARVLIVGENGTGKELVARRLHSNSSRANNPFIEINCAAIPSELIESELFGHEKGSFTSAVCQRQGKFELANGGTLFLDEIGDMSLAAQAKMLRALQEGQITRVGGKTAMSVNVRIIAATNKNLLQEIAEHRFREDLYHRLSVVIINVPPLRERREDIPVLVKFFLQAISTEYDIPCKSINEKALKELSLLPYSGNIRELRNICERLIILSPNTSITAKDVQTYATPII